MCLYYCGNIHIEDVSKHLMPNLSQHPFLRTCSSDTTLRSIEELTKDKKTSRRKTIVLLFVSGSAKWIKEARQKVLSKDAIIIITTGKQGAQKSQDGVHRSPNARSSNRSRGHMRRACRTSKVTTTNSIRPSYYIGGSRSSDYQRQAGK